jgi:hypothetical protein
MVAYLFDNSVGAFRYVAKTGTNTLMNRPRRES